jgi:hypothetical protein
MSTLNDIKYIAQIHYDMGYCSHEKIVNLIIDMFDTYYLMENMKMKEKEILNIIEEDNE